MKRSALTGGFLLYNFRHQSTRDLFPRIGQKLQILMKDNAGGDRDYGSMLAGNLDLYFPGLIKDQHFVSSIGAQKREIGDSGYGYSDFLDFPRGEQAIQSDKLYVLNNDYYAPLGYPDLGIGWLAYIKRIGISAFYDYAHVSNNNTGVDLWSGGGSIWGDFYFLRYELPVRLEYRVGYADYSKQSFSEITFSISMF